MKLQVLFLFLKDMDLMLDDKFKISVFVANTYLPEGKKLAELNLTITNITNLW